MTSKAHQAGDSFNGAGRAASAAAGTAHPGVEPARRNARLALAGATAVLLTGCASFSSDGGMDRVGELTRERTGRAVALQRSEDQRQAARAWVAERLRQPLTPQAAVDVALMASPSLQASLAGLGIAEADAVAAGRPPNPVLSFGRLSGGGQVEIDRGVLFNLLGLLSLPQAAKAGQFRFEQAQAQAALDAVRLATEVRRAYFGAVAAQELVRYAEQVKEAADAAGELALRMLQAGNFSRLAQMREQAFQAEAGAQLARARQQAVATRERLTRLLGLTGEGAGLRLPDRLPDLPSVPVAAQDAERTALAQRLDVQIARRNAEAAAAALGLAQATRLVDVLDLGLQNRSDSGAPRADGYQVTLELPLFDFGTVRTARAEAAYLQAFHRTAEVAVNARSQVRESYAAYRTAWDLAKLYRDEVVPLRQRISEENLLRYNGMLISVFELLADSREQVGAVTAAIEAARDFWIADADLQAALTGGPPAAQAASETPTRSADGPGAGPASGH